MPISRTFLYISFRAPSAGALPPGPPAGPLWRERCLFPEPSFTHLLEPPKKRFPDNIKSHLSKSLVKEPLFMFPQQGPFGETCAISIAYGLFIHSHLSRVHS
jgi:hypothetical protein